MRIAFAAFMVLHGIAHIVGFLGAWAPTRTTILGNRVDLGPSWIKVVGVAWMVLALGFGASGILTLVGVAGWSSIALAVAAASLVVCVLQLPQTIFGVVLNVTLLAGLLLGQRNGWF